MVCFACHGIGTTLLNLGDWRMWPRAVACPFCVLHDGGYGGCYDRQGRPITLGQWISQSSPDARRVAETTLPSGIWVSTVHLGLDHRFSLSGPPLIFETMVFTTAERLTELDSDRYSTEEEARAGHARLVLAWWDRG